MAVSLTIPITRNVPTINGCIVYLQELKDLLSTTKREFEDLQSQLQIDLKDIGMFC